MDVLANGISETANSKTSGVTSGPVIERTLLFAFETRVAQYSLVEAPEGAR